ncbi:MAG: hypothetical protein COC12_08075 [Rhodobacteraceae bacterium]|nr:MAG: hypothetical protein COC12_08075 [Paracoccaceae bacterium]
MQIYAQQSLVFIAVPKTGTSAVEGALKPKADIIFSKRWKHMTARRFHTKIAPFLNRVLDLRPERFAVMRDPEEQIRSWFRYRARDPKQESVSSTKGISFDEFVLAVISENAKPFAKIGSQSNMLTSGKGDLLVNHLFLYEKPLQFRAFLNQRFEEEVILRQKNVSPYVGAPLSPEIRQKLRAARSQEFDLYARLQDAGGHLQTAIG